MFKQQTAESGRKHRKALNVAIVGATGAVGLELLRCLEVRDLPLRGLKLFASPRSAGKALRFHGEAITVEPLSEKSFRGIDVALFSAGATVSKQFAHTAVEAGSVVIDNSSAFRMNAEVPLVVPEANGHALDHHRGIIANPNCVAAIAVVALAPLHRAFSIRRLSMATYQAASGAGAAAMEELRQATAAYLRGETYPSRVFPHPSAFNLFSHNAKVDSDSGYNGEELKAISETRKILGADDLPISVTCIRVPILRTHAIALTVELAQTADPEAAREVLARAEGIRIVDDRLANHFPMPSEASGQFDVLAGRLRRDLGDPQGRTLALFVVGDQLLKGAALNAVQIAEELVDKGKL